MGVIDQSPSYFPHFKSTVSTIRRVTFLPCSPRTGVLSTHKSSESNIGIC
ncbi:hypothetical protein Hanom_Chr10g00937061 [Helianthus anomalus]